MSEITGILLAAGSSRRFADSKLVVDIENRPLITYSAATLAACDRTIAVVRTDDQALQTLLKQCGVDCVFNPQPERGMGSSIAVAVIASAQSNGWCILPADMPYISASTTQQLVNALRTGAVLAAPYYKGVRGHPVAFSQQFHDELCALDGDTGAREILNKYDDQLTTIATNDAGVLVDIDTPAELEQQRIVNKNNKL